MAATAFEVLVLSALALAAFIYDGTRLWIAVVAIWTVLMGVFFGFVLGLNSRGP